MSRTSIAIAAARGLQTPRTVLRVAAAVAVATACAVHHPPPVQSSYPSLGAEVDLLEPYATTTYASAGPVEARIVGDAIPVEVDFGDPRSVETMVLWVDPSHSLDLPAAPNQRVERERSGGQRVTIRAAPGATVTAAARTAALQSTTVFDARDPAVRAAARRATGDASDDRARVDRLVRWVHDQIRYEIGDESVASRVLARGTGDCSELSLLFVAMARAAGIPARRVVGVAGTYDNGPAFGYHAWAEVALDGHWVPVDPTWNEPLADATHLVLEVDYEDRWSSRFGIDRIVVLEVTHAQGAGDLDLRSAVRELPVHLDLRLKDRDGSPRRSRTPRPRAGPGRRADR